MVRRRLAVLVLAGAALAVAGAAVRAAAEEFATVTTRVVYPGETVTGETLQDVVLNRAGRNLSAFVLARAQIAGKVARHTLLPGRLIPAGALRDAYLVETGQPVRVRYVAGSLEISVMAVPLQSGSAGDLVQLRNADSGRVIRGIVLADGTIMVSDT